MSDKLDRLRQQHDKAERHLRKATNDEKALGKNYSIFWQKSGEN